MKNVLIASVSLFILVAGSASADQQRFPAKLAGQAILPANTMVPAPADAPNSSSIPASLRRRTASALKRSAPSPVRTVPASPI